MRDEKVDNCDSFSLASDSTNNSHSTQYAISVRYIYNLLYTVHIASVVFLLHYIYHTANMFTSIFVVCVCLSQIWLVLFLHRCNLFLQQ